MDIRKFGVAIAVAILTAILIYSIADAIAPPVDYDSCYSDKFGPDPVRADQSACADVDMDLVARQTCIDQDFSYEAVYGANGCVEVYECNSCYKQQQDAQEQRNMIIFYAAIVLGLVAIVIGFILPLGSIHEWVGLGLIVGGVIGLFIGTVSYWNDLSRIVRPIVIFVELLVVLFIVYRRLANSDDDASEKPKSPVSSVSRAAKKKK